LTSIVSLVRQHGPARRLRQYCSACAGGVLALAAWQQASGRETELRAEVACA
jgi:hypothetical protein